LNGFIFLGALLNIDSTERHIELTVSAGDHSTLIIFYHRTKLKDRWTR